jgi:hypothetical protein
MPQDKSLAFQLLTPSQPAQPATFSGHDGNSDQPKIHATAHKPEATASTTAIKKAVGERRAVPL